MSDDEVLALAKLIMEQYACPDNAGMNQTVITLARAVIRLISYLAIANARNQEEIAADRAMTQTRELLREAHMRLWHTNSCAHAAYSLNACNCGHDAFIKRIVAALARPAVKTFATDTGREQGKGGE